MVYRSSLTSVEVSSTGVKVLAAGLSRFPSVAHKILVNGGVLHPRVKSIELVGDRWFPLESWLAVLEVVRKEIGPSALFALGERILENPRFPHWIRDVETAVGAMDVTYHRSHRKAGAVMYDEASGRMIEGIGHYRVDTTRGDRVIEVVCDTPYACELDFGIVTGVARKFSHRARILHAEGPCRRQGGESCRYSVNW